MKKRLYGTLIALAILGGLTQILFVKDTAQPAVTSVALEESMQGVRAMRFDEQGHLSQILRMQSWIRYQGSSTAHMITPALRVFSQDGSQWDISAKKGQGFFTDKGKVLEKIQLSDEVVVERTPQEKDNWLRLSTAALVFFPQDMLLTTDTPIHITSPQMHLHSQGLRADINEHSIEFLKKVTSAYVLPSI